MSEIEERDDADVGEGVGGEGGERAWPPAEWIMPLRAAIVTEDGETIARLHLREPTGAEFEEILRGGEATRRRLSISIITKLLMKDIAKIGIGDLVRAEAYLTSFFDIGQVIGVTEHLRPLTSTGGPLTSSDASPGAN